MPFGITGQGKAGSITPLTITSIQPAGGLQAGGEVVDIYGSGFELGMTAKIDGNLCTGLIVQSANQLTCTTPAGTAGAKAVRLDRVTTAANATLAGGYTYAADTIVSISSAGGLEDWQTTAGVVITTNFTLATPPVVTVNGVAATSIVRDSATQLTCTFPAAIVPDTADTLDADVVVDGVTSGGVAAFEYLWSPHSAQIVGLWDFRRGVTHTTTATAIANVGTGGASYDLVPCASAQAYNATDANLGNQPSITMATGGYKTGVISIATPLWQFAIVVSESPSLNLRGIMDGQTQYQRFFYKDSGPDKIALYAGAFLYGSSNWSGSTLVMADWNGASSKLYQDSVTAEATGSAGAPGTTTGLTIGEAGDRTGANVWLREIAILGVHTSAPSANTLARVLAFSQRVYGT